MTDYSIRRATAADADILSSLGARTFTETFAHLYHPDDLAAFLVTAYGPERTRRDLADPRQAAWLVETASGEAVGYAQAGPCHLPHPDVTPACGELYRFYLLGRHQGGGTGSRVWGEVMQWLEGEFSGDFWIGVWSENYGAQRFYGRHGFEKAGEYGFEVGRTVDREFILRRARAQVF